MTDQEFLSQNLDILYQNMSFPSITKDFIFIQNFGEFNSTFIALLVISFLLAILAFRVIGQNDYGTASDKNEQINRVNKPPKTIYAFFQMIFGILMCWLCTGAVVGLFSMIFFTSSLSFNSIKIDELSKLPVLKDGDLVQRDYFKKLAGEYIINMEKRYPNQSDFNDAVERGPNLDEVTFWLIRTIKGKPYEKQEIADEKLKLINDL